MIVDFKSSMLNIRSNICKLHPNRFIIDGCSSNHPNKHVRTKSMKIQLLVTKFCELNVINLHPKILCLASIAQSVERLPGLTL